MVSEREAQKGGIRCFSSVESVPAQVLSRSASASSNLHLNSVGSFSASRSSSRGNLAIAELADHPSSPSSPRSDHDTGTCFPRLNLVGVDTGDDSSLRGYERMFAALLSLRAPHMFNFNSCRYEIDKSKVGTSRVLIFFPFFSEFSPTPPPPPSPSLSPCDLQSFFLCIHLGRVLEKSAIGELLHFGSLVLQLEPRSAP